MTSETGFKDPTKPVSGSDPKTEVRRAESVKTQTSLSGEGSAFSSPDSFSPERETMRAVGNAIESICPRCRGGGKIFYSLDGESGEDDICPNCDGVGTNTPRPQEHINPMADEQHYWGEWGRYNEL